MNKRAKNKQTNAHLGNVGRIVGQIASQHLVHYAAVAPIVHRFPVSLAQQHLGSKVLGSSAVEKLEEEKKGGSTRVPKCRRSRGLVVQTLLGDAKVGHQDVAFSREQNVFRFELSP